MGKMRFCMIILSLVSSLFLLAGCGSPAEKENDIKVGTNAEFPPFEKLEGNGKITGFDAEILSAVAEAENLSLDFQHVGWDVMLNGVARGRLDAGISAITITKERQKIYDFTEPYFEAKQVILVPSASQVKTLKDLEGKKIGVQSSTTGEQVVQKAFGNTYPGLKRYDVISSAVEDLKLGRIDAVVVDEAVNAEYLKKLGKSQFKTVQDPSMPSESYGMIVKKGNRELLNQLNAGLKKIKQNGTYDKIYAKYFGDK